MIEIRRSEERGPTRLGWLDSLHTFSFGGYYDPRYPGISALRVINDDKVAPGAGFATHSHRDMEIISYVKTGAIEHQDSMGNVERLPAGEFQLMSAGTGVTHSEYNPSPSEPLEFLQIWIQPDRLGIAPGYQQQKYADRPGLTLIASADARGSSMLLHQDAELHRLLLAAGEYASYTLASGRTAYLHVVRGGLRINGRSLAAGDGAAVLEEADIDFRADTDTEALLFDLP